MSDPTPDDDRTVVRPIEVERSGPGSDAPAPNPGPAPSLGGAAAAPPKPPRHDSGNALAIGTFLDEFELRAVAGEGGFSIVYRAWDHSLNRQVAVKEFFPAGLAARVGGTQISVRSERHRETFEAGLRSFVEEARLLAHFDHPALIKVYRFWKANGSAYMVMPFCEGITLRDDWRGKPEPPDEPSLLALLDPLTEALAVLHHEHWYHRDIAPDNVILLAGTRRPLLLDFGAARQVIGDMTHALTVILKPGYAPIEQWGEVPGMKQGPWTDVYALGALIHFGIMRRTPPPSVGRLVNDNYEPLAKVAAGRYSARFLEAVDRTLVVRPEQRTQSIAQFRDESGLNELVRERTMTYLPTTALTQRLTPGTPAAAAAAPSTADEPTLRVASPDVPAAAAADLTPTMILPGTAPSPDDDVVIDVRPPQPAPSRRGLLFGLGAVGAAAAVGGAYLALRKPAGDSGPTQARVVVPPPAAASGAEAMASAAPTPPALPPAAPTYDPSHEFSRVVAAQTAGFAVEVLMPRTTLRAEKDKVEFSVRSERDGLLYVFSHGANGELLQLYPNGITPRPSVRGGQRLRLPVREDFTVTGPIGVSEILVMVSALPRDHSAFKPRKEGDYVFYPSDADAAPLVARHKGPLPLIAGVPVCPAAGACSDEFGAAVVTYTVVN